MRYDVLYDRYLGIYRIGKEMWFVDPPKDGKEHWGTGTMRKLSDKSVALGEVTRVITDDFGKIIALEVI